jgi:D-arabinose 1-dehydrogenase-like Zn-dependent alcohol dehydrogenase
MQAITVRDRDAGVGGLTLTDMPHPHAAENDVIVRVHAAGFTRGELHWPGTWSDRAGHDRTPSIPGHELSGPCSSSATEPPASPWASGCSD